MAGSLGLFFILPLIETGLLPAYIVMASSPSSMSGRRNRPGCMSGITHLFDFNQALAGRKLLTDKKYGAGLEPLGNSPNGSMEHFKSKGSTREQIEFVKSASVSRRSLEIPIKALIAEEISQELARAAEPKSRPPSVVARLMGLDALPSDRNEQGPQSRELETSLQGLPSDRLQHGKSPAHSSSRGFKSGGPPTRSVSDLSSSRRSTWEEHSSTFESLSSSQSHSHEQIPNRAFDAWKDWKYEERTRMQALDDLDVQLAAKQILIKKKLSEAKLGLLSKHSGPQEKLYESKEFMDAIDFLQANKEFFARFLEEPDSLFAKHLRNSEEPNRGKVEDLGKHSKRYSTGALENDITAQMWSREPPDVQRSPHRGSERSRERLSENGLLPQKISVKAQQKQVKSSKYMVNSEEECQQAPTRIVVLKPGPGKVRNLMSLSQSSPRSPREFLDAMEVFKESSMDVLQDLRHKLQQEDGRGDLRKTWTSVNEHSKPVRDPREIAREIARQVRENVIKDMRSNLKKGTMNETGSARKMESTGIIDDDTGGVNASCKGSSVVLGSDDGYMPVLSSPLRGNKGELRRSLFVEKCLAQSTDPPGAALRSHHRHRDRGRLHKQRGPRVRGVEVIYANRNHSVIETDVDCDTDSCTHSVCESEADAYAKSENPACITLLRSRSVPTSRPSFHDGMQELDEETGRNGIFLAGEDKMVDVDGSFDAAIHRSGPFKRSVFSRKRVGAKDSLLKSKAYVKELEETPVLIQEMPTKKSHQDEFSEHEKAQHQIDDLGPVLDSDSSVSSLDNFLTLEAALMAEDLDGPELPAGATLPTTEGNATSRKPKLLSPSESPRKLKSLTDVEPTAADPETSNPPEQPSPVSVLDAPFHEETASPMDFTEISSGLQGLRVRLQLLKFVDQEAVSNPEEYQEEDCELIQDANNHLHSIVNDVECSPQRIENSDLLVDGIVCHQGREPELIYLKHVLVASGFTVDSTTVLTRWHSPSQPLAACIFERVENSYGSSSEEGRLDAQTRRLLFDGVNEILLQVLGPHVNCRTWWKYPQMSSSMPLGRDLVGQVWFGVCKLLRSHSEGQDTLGSLVAEDLANKDRWQDFSLNIEMVILGVEKAIWNDLLEDSI